MRAMCGATRPIKPIGPTKATASAENADAQQRGQPQTAHVDAEAHGPVFTQTQRGQFPRAHHRQRQQHGEYAEQDAQLVPRGARQAAHGPEHQPLQRVLAGDELHHRYQRVEGKHQRDAEQHHAGGGDPRPARDAVEHQRGEQRKDKGVGGDEPLIGNARNADAEHDRQRGAKGRGGRHAEGKGAGQRVIQDGLHFRPGQAKRKAHHHRHQRVRQADVPDDHPRAGIGRGGSSSVCHKDDSDSPDGPMVKSSSSEPRIASANAPIINRRWRRIC